MNILKASHKIVRFTPDMLDAIDEAARTCYLSEPKDTPELRDEFRRQATLDPLLCMAGSVQLSFSTAFEYWVQAKFIKGLIKKGHTTPFEYGDIEIEFICDRGVSHEAVRHRLCSPMQESTRYCNYGNNESGINVIDPIFFDVKDPNNYYEDDINGSLLYQINRFDVWLMCMEYAEWGYLTLLKMGASPQEARSVLPNSLKTKLKIKANVREWFHIFNLRAVNPGAHPQIREVMIPALEECATKWPVLFGTQAKELSK